MAESNEYLPLFTALQTDLDEHHTKRDAVAKASRDITAAAKKVIFALHRSTPSSQSAVKPLQGNISTAFRTTRDHMPSQGDTWRYKSQMSPGLQELVEALLFQSWLENGTVMNWEETSQSIQVLAIEDGKPETVKILLTHEDYLLGMLDFTGEVMRWCITSIARGGHSQYYPQNLQSDPKDSGKPTYMSGLRVLRDIYASISMLSLSRSSFSNEVSKKLEVLESSVEKVENAVYSVAVRGAEQTFLKKDLQ